MTTASQGQSRQAANLSAILALAGGCLLSTSMASADDAPQKGGKLVVARPADVVQWDPKFTNDNDSLWAEQQIFATLLQNSDDGKELKPSLAESWSLDPSGKVYSFKLRDNAKFCDGTPITAEDVKFSFERGMEQDSAISWQYPSKPKVAVVDDHRLTITLDQPNVSFASFLTLWGTDILSKAYAGKVGVAALSEKPLGSGPFCLDSWEKGQSAVLKPNPGYWNPAQPYVDEVELRVVPDDNARVLQLQAGEVDIDLSVPYSQMAVLKKTPGVVLGEDTLYGTAALVPNVSKVPALADVKVRQAIARALDRQAMVDSILFGEGEVAKSPFYGPGILYWTGDFEVKYDLDAARKLMSESTVPNGFGVELTIPSGDALASQTSVIVKDQLSKIGVDVTIAPVESGTWWELWSTGQFQLLYKLGTNDVIDPAENIPFDFWLKSEGGSDSAFTGYHNARIVELSQQAAAEQNVEKRTALYRELQKIAMDEMPQFYLYHPKNVWANRDDVHGFAIFPTKLHNFSQVWKSPK